MLFCRLLIFFQNYFFQKNLSGISSECQTVWIQIKIVGPDLGPNCLQSLSADDTRSTTKWPYNREMPPKDTEGSADSADPDQTNTEGAI